MRGLAQAVFAINHSDRILVSGHVNPDGDSIGSTLALAIGIERLGKEVVIMSPDGVPKRYRVLPGARRIVRDTDVVCDLAIAVDCGSKALLGHGARAFDASHKILEIDHHEFRTPYGDAAFIDHEASSVGEMVFFLLQRLGVKITRSIAHNILASILVETNSFRLPMTRSRTFEVCAELVRAGVDFYRLADTIFWSRSKASMLLLGVCLSRCLFLNGGRIAWSIVRTEDFRKIRGREEDVDAVVDEMRSMKPVKAAVLFRQRDNGDLRVSLRSKGKFNIASVAEKYGGGGHYDAAGCIIKNEDAAITRILSDVKKLVG